MHDFIESLNGLKPEIEAALDELLPSTSESPTRLHEAMRYATLGVGKRVRPGLIVLVGEALGGTRSDLLSPAAAVELIHGFSLIHDDLPALDDDDLRRGRATVHRRFDEATAILAGDALLGLGLGVLAQRPESQGADVRLRAVSLIAAAVG
ncbi:MAG TPA: polyprenyl synthetase family protein, partial [Thermoanaerobaculia bacterium]|nr:polyprenyl synthetase family protein [Thermoanaerobaculia bacterium]